MNALPPRPEPLSVDDAQRRLLALMTPVGGAHEVTLSNAIGRVLAEDLLSPVDVPPHDNAAMDGFAFDGAALAEGEVRRFHIVGSALAGHPFTLALAPGQAVRITTGAVMPTGADTVLMQEQATIEPPSGESQYANAQPTQAPLPVLVVPPGQRRGQHRRSRGEDLAKGACALPAGTWLGPAALGLIASLGLPTVKVRRRARVAILSTGDEVLPVGAPPQSGRIFDSNRYTIGAMLEANGVELIDLGLVPDSTDALDAILTTALGAQGQPQDGPGSDGQTSERPAHVDLIVSSGGVSFGESDLTRVTMAKRGDISFHQVAMRPGRPLAFGRIGQTCFIGLPGNPVAAMIAFRFIVRPAILALMGATPRLEPTLRVRLAEPIDKRPGRTEYQRATLQRGDDQNWRAQLTGDQGSGILRSMQDADCILVLPAEAGNLEAGDWVDAVPMSGMR